VVLLVVASAADADVMGAGALALAAGAFRPAVVVTGEEPGAPAVLRRSGVRPVRGFVLRRPGQTAAQSTSRATAALARVLEDTAPSFVVVRGSTTSALAAAVVAGRSGIPVVRVDDGPPPEGEPPSFPAGANRTMLLRLATRHLALTEAGAAALRAAGVPPADVVTVGARRAATAGGLGHVLREVLDGELRSAGTAG
jgi:UDP-N-acetylglucosamine 2-epimerase (non-hydrolysing)